MIEKATTADRRTTQAAHALHLSGNGTPITMMLTGVATDRVAGAEDRKDTSVRAIGFGEKIAGPCDLRGYCDMWLPGHCWFPRRRIELVQHYNENCNGFIGLTEIVPAAATFYRVTPWWRENAALYPVWRPLCSQMNPWCSNAPGCAIFRQPELLAAMGAEVELGYGRAQHRTTIHCENLASPEASYELVKTMRASTLVLGPLVARCGASAYIASGR